MSNRNFGPVKSRDSDAGEIWYRRTACGEWQACRRRSGTWKPAEKVPETVLALAAEHDALPPRKLPVAVAPNTRQTSWLQAWFRWVFIRP